MKSAAALTIILGLCPLLAHACFGTAGDPKYGFRVAADRKAVEVVEGSSPVCLLALDCAIRPAPVRVSYSVRRESPIDPSYLRNVVGVRFHFADGTEQSCGVTSTPLYIPRRSETPDVDPKLKEFFK